MMICDMVDEEQIGKIHDSPLDLHAKANPFHVRQWLDKGTRYGKAELLHSIDNHNDHIEGILDSNRAVEKNVVSEMEQLLKEGKFDYFLFIRGNHRKQFMLVHAADALAGTITYRSLPTEVCETRAPFLRQPSCTGEMQDILEDWSLFGLKADPNLALASTVSRAK